MTAPQTIKSLDDETLYLGDRVANGAGVFGRWIGRGRGGLVWVCWANDPEVFRRMCIQFDRANG
jgi:hypothetical protein